MPSELPLLPYTTSLFSHIDLEEVTLIACQHLLGTTINLFDQLFAKGLKPEHVFIIGKCYSSHPHVIRELKKRGIYVSPYSTSFKSHLSFDEQFNEYIEKFLLTVSKKIKQKTGKKIIILDDGGALLHFANDFFSKKNPLVGIEQTTSGFQKIKDVKLRFPVINIARSQAKLSVESPFIAEKVVEKIVHIIKEKRKRNPHILLVGNGSIGKHIFSLLKKKCNITTYDSKTHKNIFPGNFEKKLHTFDIIIGATGTAIITPGHFTSLKKDVSLVSCSSSDREFSAAYLRCLKRKTKQCHKDISVNGITLHNSGFPINFDGKIHSVDPKYIQFTRALLLAGVFQAVATPHQNGFIDLDKKIQNSLTKKFKSLL